MIIIIVLKSNSMVDLGQNSGHWSWPESWVWLTWVSVWIKIIFVIILKPDLKIDSGQGPDYKWGWLLTRVNIRTKIFIIIILKPDSGVNIGLFPGHVSGGSTRVDLGQHKIK